MSTKLSCSRVECLRSAVTVLMDKDYCFDHFCSRCYELLERNQRMPGRAGSPELSAELAELDECARRALEISFGRVELNNLDRARLLDILLWAGDLTTALRHRRTAPPDLSGAFHGGKPEHNRRGDAEDTSAVSERLARIKISEPALGVQRGKSYRASEEKTEFQVWPVA